MSVFKRGSKYHYEVMIDGTRYRGSTGEVILSRARQFEAAMTTRIREGRHSPSLSPRHIPTLRGLSGKFLEFVQQTQHMKAKTKEYYEYGLQLLDEQSIMGMKIDRLTTQDADCITIPGSPSTANCGLRTLRRMLNLAEEWGLLNKAPKIRLHEEIGRSVTIGADAEKRLADSLAGTCSPAIQIIMDTGARPQEVCNMRIQNVDFDRGSIFVESGKTRKARRYLPMSDRVKEVLRAQIGDHTEGWVFPSTRCPGEPIQRASLTQGFATARNALGLPKELKLYSARHSFATDIMERTGNVFLLQELMGHTDVKTLGRYQHPSIAAVSMVVNQRNLERGFPQNPPQLNFGIMEGPDSQLAIA